jgi:hypothetical protein
LLSFNRLGNNHRAKRETIPQTDLRVTGVECTRSACLHSAVTRWHDNSNGRAIPNIFSKLLI